VLALALTWIPGCAFLEPLSDSDGGVDAEQDAAAAEKGAYRCELVERLVDDTGRITVEAYSLPRDAGVGYLRYREDMVVLAGSKRIYGLETTGDLCDSLTAQDLPANLSDLGQSMELLIHEDRLIIAYERGVVSVSSDLSEVVELLRFADYGKDPVLSVHAMAAFGDELLIAGWDDYDELDDERYRQIREIYGGSLKRATTSPADQRFRDLMGTPMIMVGLDDGEVTYSPLHHTVFDAKLIGDGDTLYVADDFGSDLLCPVRPGMRHDTFFAGCEVGGAQSTMSINALRPELCDTLGFPSTDQCFLAPETHRFKVVGVPFGHLPTLPVISDSVGGSDPIFWDVEELSSAGGEFLVSSGRPGGYWNRMFGSGLPLRNTCFSLYGLEFEQRDPHMRVGAHVCTQTDQLAVSNELLAVTCPADSDASDCFVAVNMATSPEAPVLYWIEVR
jgi:hypothetical protein